MTQTRVWAIPKITNTRVTDTGGSGQGAGASDTMTVGRRGSTGTRRNHKAYLRPTTNWSGVRTLTSAILTVTGAELFDGHDDPVTILRRLTSAFTEGASAGFDSGDYTAPGITTVGQVTTHMARAADSVTNIDITAIAKRWAPSTVAGGSGSVAAADARNFGIALVGTTDTDEDWVGYTESIATAGFRPFVTITYEEGPTVPNAPINASPVGTVASLSAFEMDFTDPRAADTLAVTEIDWYGAGTEKTSTGGSTADVITLASHGYHVGDMLRCTLAQDGVGLVTEGLYYVRSVPSSSTFKVSATATGAVVNITTAYGSGDLKFRRILNHITKAASNTEIVADHSFVLPDGIHPTVNVAQFWRGRQRDQEGKWSPFTAVLTVTVTNDDPTAPADLTPDADGTPAAADLDTLLGTWFRGGSFADVNVGDTMLAYQFQMSALPEGDIGWDEAGSLKWDTGKVYVAAGTDFPESQYGGADLTAGDWYWRVRVWDQHDGLSDWSYARITLLNDFDATPGSQDAIQVNPHAPWRIRIREMKYNSLAGTTGAVTGVQSTGLFTTAKNHGMAAGLRVRFSAVAGATGVFTDRTYYVIASGLAAKTFRLSLTLNGTSIHTGTGHEWTSGNVTSGTLTAVTTRGPGNVVASLEDAKSVGATIVYNSPGEAHFTLPIDHPQISVIEPKQTHYGIDFYTGDGWRETYAGLVWDLDANEQDGVFICLDYLALLDLVSDERYYPNEPNRAAANGGSFYANKTIRTIVLDQLTRATTKLANSPVGFIGIGTIATMNEQVNIYSTMQPVLSFISGLIDSHRQGTPSGPGLGVKKTRIKVQRTNVGGYEFVVEDAPGQTRDNLRLRYGEMVNGYRQIVFGNAWSSLLHAIGRTREGIRVLYKTVAAPGVDQRVWGRFARAVIMDNVSDENDLKRRAQQAAIKGGKIGAGLALQLRTGVLRPRDGYDVTDDFPVDILHGVVNTDAYGSGYYTCWAIAWEAQDNGQQDITLTLTPREDTAAASTDLIAAHNVSTQAEWQITYAPATPAVHTAARVLDQNTGITYTRDDDSFVSHTITGTV